MSKKKPLKIKKEPKTILTKRGYAIVKNRFEFKTIHKCKSDLTVKPFVKEDYGAKATPFPIYLESKKKIYLPKHYGVKIFGEPDEVKITKGVEIDVKFKGSLRPKQTPIVNAFMDSLDNGKFVNKSNGGIVSVPCGWGKTIIALNLISKLKRKTIIIVHKGFLLNQWEQRINEFLPGARIGRIQGPVVDIDDKDIVIAMLQSISMKDYDTSVFVDFGFTIVDECHHIAAEVFSRSLPKINSYYSLGLSATPNRADGLQTVFSMFLGPMLYRITSADDKKVLVRSIEYNDSNYSYSKQEVTAYGKMCVPRMITNISENENRNKLIIFLAKTLVEAGKQVLLLSDRRKHLNYLHDKIAEFTTVGYYVGGMKQKDLDISEKAKVILGTFPMSSEGLDIPTLDSIIFATPKSSIEQSIGRITRKKHEKLPIAYDIIDNFGLFPRQYMKREAVYKRLKYDVYSGSLTVTNNQLSDSAIEYMLDTGFTKKDFSRKKRKKKEEKAVCLIDEE